MLLCIGYLIINNSSQKNKKKQLTDIQNANYLVSYTDTCKPQTTQIRIKTIFTKWINPHADCYWLCIPNFNTIPHISSTIDYFMLLMKTTIYGEAYNFIHRQP